MHELNYGPFNRVSAAATKIYVETCRNAVVLQSSFGGILERLELINEIKSHIDMWLAAKPNRNITSLAREAGVSESCTRRIYNNNSVPKNDNLMKILVVLSGESSIERLRKHFESQAQVLKFLMNNYSFLESASFVDDATPLLRDEIHIEDYHSFLVYAFASNRTPITPANVTTMLGVIGELALEDLVEKGLIKVNSNNYLEPKVKNLRPSKDLIKRHLPDIAKMFFKLDNPFNCHILQSETVSKKGYGLAMDAFEKFLAEIGNVIQNNPGEVPLVVAGFLDTLTLKPYFKEEAK